MGETGAAGANPTQEQETKRAQFLHDVFVTAMEGGVSYWARVTEYHWSLDPVRRQNREPDLDGFRAVLLELDEEARYVVDRSVIERGLAALAEGTCTFGGRELEPRTIAHYAGLDRTNGEGRDWDANTADNIVQAGLFGDVRYG